MTLTMLLCSACQFFGQLVGNMIGVESDDASSSYRYINIHGTVRRIFEVYTHLFSHLRFSSMHLKFTYHSAFVLLLM